MKTPVWCDSSPSILASGFGLVKLASALLVASPLPCCSVIIPTTDSPLTSWTGKPIGYSRSSASRVPTPEGLCEAMCTTPTVVSPSFIEGNDGNSLPCFVGEPFKGNDGKQLAMFWVEARDSWASFPVVPSGSLGDESSLSWHASVVHANAPVSALLLLEEKGAGGSHCVPIVP